MEIRFISSLTSEDEVRVASAVVDFVSALLDQGSIAYTLRVETESGTTFQCTHASLRGQESTDESVDIPPPSASPDRSEKHDE